jgi:hypothetical protein
MSQPKVLVDAFGAVLKSAGFKKKKADTWYLNCADTIQLLNVQKSSYGQQHYVNLAIWLKPIGESETPPEHKCQIRLRWSALFAEDDELPKRLVDLEDDSISDEARKTGIIKIVESHVLPFFSRTMSIDNLKALYQAKSFPKQCSINVKAQELLSR